MKFIFTIIVSVTMKGYLINPLLISEKVTIQNFPYMVSVILKKDKVDTFQDIFRGAGCIIQRYFVITTAKCLLLVSEEQISNKKIYVRRNTTFWKKPGFDHLVIKKFEHPYHRQPENDFNIALLKVEKPFGLKYEQLLILPNHNFYDGGWLANVTGWGSTNKDRGEPETYLQHIQIKIVDRTTCRSLYDWHWTPRLFCADKPFDERSGPCYYDSGDPVVSNNTLIGLATKLSCGKELPDMYVSIYPLKRWIMGILLTVKE